MAKLPCILVQPIRFSNFRIYDFLVGEINVLGDGQTWILLVVWNSCMTSIKSCRIFQLFIPFFCGSEAHDSVAWSILLSGRSAGVPNSKQDPKGDGKGI